MANLIIFLKWAFRRKKKSTNSTSNENESRAERQWINHDDSPATIIMHADDEKKVNPKRTDIFAHMDYLYAQSVEKRKKQKKSLENKRQNSKNNYYNR